MGNEARDHGSGYVVAATRFLGRAGFTGNAVTGNTGATTASLFHNRFHPAAHRRGNVCPEHPLFGRAGVDARQGGATAQAAGDVGLHQPAAVGNGTMELQQLEGCEGDALSEGGGSTVDGILLKAP